MRLAAHARDRGNKTFHRRRWMPVEPAQISFASHMTARAIELKDRLLRSQRRSDGWREEQVQPARHATIPDRHDAAGKADRPLPLPLVRDELLAVEFQLACVS